MKKLLFSAVVLLSAINIDAVTYFASPSGSGDGSSYSFPTTLSAGISKLASGDTLFLLEGQYDLSATFTINKNGTANARTVIANYQNEKPILDFRKETYGNRGLTISSSATYLHIKGLTIRYAGKNGIYQQGSYCIIENCDVYGCGDTGIQHKIGGNNLIKNCDSHDNFDYETLSGTTANYGGNADGFADKQYSTTNGNTYYGCRSWNNSDDGWDFYQRIGNDTISQCICYQNGPKYYDMSKNPRRLGVDSTFFNNLKGKTVTDRYGNTQTITDSKFVNLGNGNGFKLGGDYTLHNVVLYNCLSIANNVNGFDKNNNKGNMEIYNGTSYANNGANYGFGNANLGNLVIKNSVSLNGAKDDAIQGVNVVNDHNSWNTAGVECTSADFSSIDTSLVLTSRNSDGSLATTNFLRLADGSHLIDAGSDAKLPYSGTAPDLGCYEKGSIDKYPGIVSTPEEKDQEVSFGKAVEDIKFTWSGGATSLSVSKLPAGVTSTIDNTTKNLTISGTPTVAGTYAYTVYTIGGTDIPDSVSGTLKIANIVIPNNKDQTIATSNAIENIIFSWVSNATSLTVKGLPSGLDAAFNTAGDTMTISGTVSANAGTYTYTVYTIGGTTADSVSGTITIIDAFDMTKYYNIYTYGIAFNSKIAIASTTYTKKFITADASTNKVALMEGTSEDAEADTGTPDSIRALYKAQWFLSKGTNDGYVTIKNRETGKYLTISSALSSAATNVYPLYKTIDNSKKAYAICLSPTGNCLQISQDNSVTSTSYADRIRMRWIFDEVDDESAVNNATIKKGFLSYNVTKENIEIKDPQHISSIEILNINAQQIKKINVSSSIINISALPNGLYIVKGQGKNGNLYLDKIIKQ